MERITVTSYFHTAHRQIGYPGKCAWVHGHTWRGKIHVSCEEFPQDAIDMAVDFGDLKKVMRDMDHRIIVTKDDKTFQNSDLFEPEGVVLIEGRGPSVENVARHIWKGVVEVIRSKFPNRQIHYTIEVELQETDNNFFTIVKGAVV